MTRTWRPVSARRGWRTPPAARLAIAGVLLAQRKAVLGKSLVGIGGLVPMVGLFGFGGRQAEG